MKITHDSNRHVIIVPLAALIQQSPPNYRLATRLWTLLTILQRLRYGLDGQEFESQ